MSLFILTFVAALLLDVRPHVSKDGEMSLRKHMLFAHTKRKYISVCLCHTTLLAYQSSLQGKVAVETVAMESRHDPQIAEANMKALSYGRERGRKGSWGGASKRGCPVNSAGLHNLRLMRKQWQIKSPSFYSDWLCSTGALFDKKVSEAVLEWSVHSSELRLILYHILNMDVRVYFLFKEMLSLI